MLSHPGTHSQIEITSRRITEQPKDARLYLKRAELYRQHGSLAEAEKDVKRAAALVGESAEILLLLARVRIDQEQRPEAMQLLDQSIRKEALIPAYLQRAKLSMAMGEPLPAALDYDRALYLFKKPFPAQPDVYIGRARAYAQAGEIDLALKGLQEGIDENGPLIALQDCALELELEAGKWDEALVRIAGILEGAPRKESWLVRRAEVLRTLNRPEEAEKDLRKARELIHALPESRQQVPAMRALRERIAKNLNE